MHVSIDVTIVKLGQRYLAVSQIGGIQCKSAPSGGPEPAIRNLFWKLSGNGPLDEEADLAVALLVEGTNLSEELEKQSRLPALPAHEESPDNPFAEVSER